MTYIKKYAKNLVEAKKLYKLQTGREFDIHNNHYGISIFKLKHNKTLNRKFFIGSDMEYINL